ncbi:MAG: galactonate dehydratase, partial [Bryobacteraceae bacterium]
MSPKTAPRRRGGLDRRQWLASIAYGAVPLASAFAAKANALSRIKITGFTIHKVSVRWRDLVFLEVHTDAGVTGLGEATLEGRSELTEAALRWLEESMVGRDPSGPEQHWNRNYYLLSRWRNGPAAMSALSAVDIALWDIEGKRLGVP